MKFPTINAPRKLIMLAIGAALPVLGIVYFGTLPTPEERQAAEMMRGVIRNVEVPVAALKKSDDDQLARLKANARANPPNPALVVTAPRTQEQQDALRKKQAEITAAATARAPRDATGTMKTRRVSLDPDTDCSLSVGSSDGQRYGHLVIACQPGVSVTSIHLKNLSDGTTAPLTGIARTDNGAVIIDIDVDASALQMPASGGRPSRPADTLVFMTSNGRSELDVGLSTRSALKSAPR